MEKFCLLKEMKHLFTASVKQPSVIDVPGFHYVMVDGQGDPNSAPEYGQAVEAVFSVSYAAKFACKKERPIEYGVMPLQCLWWSDGPLCSTDKGDWKWTTMILQPACVTESDIQAALAQVRSKKKLPALDALRWSPYTEGRCAQILHVGPFSEEGPTIARLHDWIAGQGFSMRGRHHEIYLSDIRRTAPERWKTLVRQPVT